MWWAEWIDVNRDVEEKANVCWRLNCKLICGLDMGLVAERD